jgi:hypothetical protein
MKNIIFNFIIWASVVIMILAILSFIAFEIYLWITYGGKPIEEIPFWAIWLMWGEK